VRLQQVEELTSPLLPAEVDRALAHQDPIASTSTEAAVVRSSRFHTVAPEETAQQRQSRFGAANGGNTNASSSTSSTSAAPLAPNAAELLQVPAARVGRFGTVITAASSVAPSDVPPEVATKRESRFGPAATTITAPPVDAASVTEFEKKRLDRFKA